MHLSAQMPSIVSRGLFTLAGQDVVDVVHASHRLRADLTAGLGLVAILARDLVAEYAPI